jgi:catechol 2,3-dioxygenase-like lactoylglutathione lyase family enzyme
MTGTRYRPLTRASVSRWTPDTAAWDEKQSRQLTNYSAGVHARFDHCVIAVSDWERSNAFYRDVLAAELVPREQGWAYRFGEQQLKVHGPGISAGPVACPGATRKQRSVLRMGRSDRAGNCSSRGEWRSRRRDQSSATAPAAGAAASTSEIPTERCWSSSPTNEPVRALSVAQQRPTRGHETQENRHSSRQQSCRLRP